MSSLFFLFKPIRGGRRCADMIIIYSICASFSLVLGIYFVVIRAVDVYKRAYSLPRGMFLLGVSFILWALLFIAKALSY